MSDYNGYTNRATWNVALWLNNDEAIYRDMRAFATKYDGKVSKGRARWFAISIFGDRTPDNCRLTRVNWAEIAEAINEAVRAELNAPPQPRAEVERCSGSYCVVVDGQHKVSRESYVIANNIAWAINNGADGTSESDEVARAILDHEVNNKG